MESGESGDGDREGKTQRDTEHMENQVLSDPALLCCYSSVVFHACVPLNTSTAIKSLIKLHHISRGQWGREAAGIRFNQPAAPDVLQLEKGNNKEDDDFYDNATTIIAIVVVPFWIQITYSNENILAVTTIFAVVWGYVAYWQFCKSCYIAFISHVYDLTFHIRRSRWWWWSYSCSLDLCCNICKCHTAGYFKGDLCAEKTVCF